MRLLGTHMHSLVSNRDSSNVLRGSNSVQESINSYFPGPLECYVIALTIAGTLGRSERLSTCLRAYSEYTRGKI